MAITIKGVRVDALSISRAEDNSGNLKLTGNYAIISSVDKVIALQHWGGYSELDLKLSADSIKKMDDFIKAVKKELNEILGMEGGEQ